MRDRLLNAAESFAFGVFWLYLAPAVLVFEWLFGEDEYLED